VSRQSPARQKREPGEPEATGANLTDRGKCGVKRHLLTDGWGVSLATVISGANRTDMKKLAALLDAVVYEAPPDGERHLCRDRGYATAACRETVVAHGYAPHIPPERDAAHPLPAPGDPDRHPPRRWEVEVAHSWCNRCPYFVVIPHCGDPSLPSSPTPPLLAQFLCREARLSRSPDPNRHSRSMRGGHQIP